MLYELISCLYQLAYGKAGFIVLISLKVTEPIGNIKWALTVLQQKEIE